jgi:hypothetical protein
MPGNNKESQKGWKDKINMLKFSKLNAHTIISRVRKEERKCVLSLQKYYGGGKIK